MSAMLVIRPGDFEPTLRAIDALIDALQLAPQRPLTKYGRDATANMKEQHDRDAHAIQRYVNRTYYLTTSIGFEVARVDAGTWRLRMFAPPVYAEAVEYGTPKSAAYPFFWVEVYGFQDVAVKDIAAAFFGLLERHEKSIR